MTFRVISFSCVLGLLLAVSYAAVDGQGTKDSAGGQTLPGPAGGPEKARPTSADQVRPTSAASAGQPRALLDTYCVTCHNDRLKTANLTLQNLDLAEVA